MQYDAFPQRYGRGDLPPDLIGLLYGDCTSRRSLGGAGGKSGLSEASCQLEQLLSQFTAFRSGQLRPPSNTNYQP